MSERCYFDWQSPESLRDLAESDSLLLGLDALKRRGKDFREAFAASRFALHRRATSVRLIKPRDGSQTPDFAMLLNKQELWFETTEIDRPGRRRGDEPFQSGFVAYADGEWTSPDELGPVVTERVAAKVSKTYDKCDGLLIWFNAFPVDRARELTTEWWNTSAEPARDHFAETWVHQSSRFTQLFQ